MQLCSEEHAVERYQFWKCYCKNGYLRVGDIYTSYAVGVNYPHGYGKKINSLEWYIKHPRI